MDSEQQVRQWAMFCHLAGLAGFLLPFGNVLGPLVGSGVSALMGFRWVFVITAVLVLCNTLQLFFAFRKPRGKG